MIMKWKIPAAFVTALAILSVAPVMGQDTTATASIAQPGAQDADTQVVPVKLKMGTLGFETVTINKPKASFEIENVCTVPHAFEVEGEVGGEEVEFATKVLQPGEKTTMIVHLPPGSYEAYCPVGKHAENGMTGTVVFAASK